MPVLAIAGIAAAAGYIYGEFGGESEGFSTSKIVVVGLAAAAGYYIVKKANK